MRSTKIVSLVESRYCGKSFKNLSSQMHHEKDFHQTQSHLHQLGWRGIKTESNYRIGSTSIDFRNNELRYCACHHDEYDMRAFTFLAAPSPPAVSVKSLFLLINNSNVSSGSIFSHFMVSSDPIIPSSGES